MVTTPDVKPGRPLGRIPYGGFQQQKGPKSTPIHQDPYYKDSQKGALNFENPPYTRTLSIRTPKKEALNFRNPPDNPLRRSCDPGSYAGVSGPVTDVAAWCDPLVVVPSVSAFRGACGFENKVAMQYDIVWHHTVSSHNII